VQVAVVGDRQAVHPELPDLRHEVGDPVRSVEERAGEPSATPALSRLESSVASSAAWLAR